MFNYDFDYYFTKYKKPLKWVSGGIVVILVIGCIIHAIYAAESHKGKIAIPLRVVPSDAQITIDKTTDVHNGTIYLTPGMHTVVVTKDGFATTEKQYRIEDYNSPAVYIALLAESNEAKDWRAAHQNEYRELELLSTKQAHVYAEDFRERNPIVKDLPIKDPYFTISYRNVEDKDIKLVIWGTSPRYREFALDYLRKKGYEPTNYVVEFENFHNPLLEKEAHHG